MPGVSITATELAAAINDLSGSSARLLPVASAIVEKYADAGTPVEILNESTIRVAGYLLEQPSSSLRTLRLADLSRSWTPGMGVLRGSGAMSILSPWKLRRGSLV